MLAETVKYSLATLAVVLLLAQGAGKLTSRAARVSPPQARAAAAAPERIGAAVPTQGQVPVNRPFSTLDEYSIEADVHGHFADNAIIDGQSIRVLIDTGASTVALRYEDAASLLIFPSPSEFTLSVNTANGVTKAAPVKLREIQLGNIRLGDVDAIVLQRGASNASLLGMSFLSRLSRVEMAAGSLLLRR
jgi:aspartyl protease family protein